MSQPLPVFIAPLRFCEMRLTLAGTLGLDEMDRLAEFLSDREGEVVLSLSFDEDARGIPFAEMTLDARLRLVCQRCLGPWETHVRREVRLGFTRDPDAAGRIAEHGYEPAVLERNELKLRDLVEDELLLALPMIPKHEREDCQPYLGGDSERDEDLPARDNPFAVLARLKGRKEH